jgi:hypothetical protein
LLMLPKTLSLLPQLSTKLLSLKTRGHIKIFSHQTQWALWSKTKSAQSRRPQLRLPKKKMMSEPWIVRLWQG